MSTPPSPIHFTPIGVVRSPFREKVEAPRQATAAEGVEGRIELFPGHNYEDALSDLSGWERIWVLFVFDRNPNWRPKVLPPRSTGGRRGLFSTRSPHRPNPIGMSVVRLASIDGLTLHIRDLDILDGSPVLDLKPYVPYADAFPHSRSGWLDEQSDAPAPSNDAPLSNAPANDPGGNYHVTWSECAEAERIWLETVHAIVLRDRVEQALKLGPQPHAYRRIRKEGDSYVLAMKEWRIRFALDGKQITVIGIFSGYRPKELATGVGAPLDIHRAFIERFGR